jgi:hypothetical protein
VQIFIHRDDQEFGPYTLDQIEGFLTEGKITPEDLCRANDETDWSTVARRLAMAIPARLLSAQQSPTVELQPLLAASPQDTETKNLLLGFVGAIVFIGGLGGLVYYWQFFDVSVDSGLDRIVNMGLMQDRQNGMIASGIFTLLGFNCLVAGIKK